MERAQVVKSSHPGVERSLCHFGAMTLSGVLNLAKTGFPARLGGLTGRSVRKH